MQIEKRFKEKYQKKSAQLHSPAHLLADELSRLFKEPKHFGFYLKMATLHDPNMLRRISGEVLESKAKKPGALFTYLLKKELLKPKGNDLTDSKIPRENTESKS